MKKVIGIVGLLVCGFLAFANFSAVNTRSNYIEACLYISQNPDLNDGCYSVYPETHSRDAWIWGIVSTVGALIFLGVLLSANSQQPTGVKQNESK